MALNILGNPSQVRVFDPVLSNVVLGYKAPTLVGSNLFPPVPVQAAGGQVLEFGPEAFQEYHTQRAPGGSTTRVEFGYQGKSFALMANSLEGKVPMESLRDASAVLHLDLSIKAVQNAMQINLMQLEREQAALAINPATYQSSNKNTALSGASLWSAKSTGDPFQDIEEARYAIRSQCGMDPNTMVLSASAFKAIRVNDAILKHFIYTDATSVTVQKLTALFDIENIVVGKAVTYDAIVGWSDIWGDNAVLAYVPPGASSQMEPSFGYTYFMQGHPYAEQAYLDRNTKSWIYPVTYERVAVTTGISSGYLIANVV